MSSHALGVIRRSDPEPVECLLGLLMAAYGAWLAMPWTTWNLAPGGACDSGAFDILSAVWRYEIVQGSAFVLVGAGHVMSAFRQLDSRTRLVFAALAAGMWSITWVSFLLWRWQSSAVPVYGVHALSHAWLVARHLREIRAQRRLRRGHG